MCFQIYVQIQERTDEISEGATSLSLNEKENSSLEGKCLCMNRIAPRGWGERESVVELVVKVSLEVEVVAS